MRVVSLFVVAMLLGVAAPARGDALGVAREVAQGGYQGARFSPDGAELLVTGPELRGLYRIELASRAVQRVDDEAAAGVHARYLADGGIAFRVRRAGALVERVLDRDGHERMMKPAARIAEVTDDRLYVRGTDDVVREVGTGDRFFAPVLSPDGRRVAFQGLATGIYVYDRGDHSLRHLGPGTAPAWSPDGDRLAFERTEDDGHAITASDLYLFDLTAGRLQALTRTDRRLERRPSFSPDGRRLAFDDDRGGVFVADLVEDAP